MVASQTITRKSKAEMQVDFDAVVIGAGVSGLYQLYKLRELGLTVRVFEAGTGVGGTWYWNRYPGARFDSESWTYGYSFSQELLDEWDWEEHFAGQPETERYLNHVADKFDLRRDIQFKSRVAAAHYRDNTRSWDITLEDGRCCTARFLVTAVGVLSAATLPNIPGVKDFQGPSFHTHYWPKRPVSFAGKRVAVIGTGATGIQTITEVAKTAGRLTVFQRTPQWAAPLHNARITKEEMNRIRANYTDIFARCQETFGCFIHTADPRSALEVTEAEREAFWQKLYGEPGFGIWMGNFRDILVDRQANRLISDFVARKTRERVKDPVVAEKLIPKTYGFGTRRVPLESGYFEVYNHPNVELVDLTETPIERITPTGIETSVCEYEFDMIIFATGFDAITGAFDRIDIRGVDNVSLKDKWRDGPQTFLGIMVDDFPNMLMVMGPHAGLGNFPRAAEYSADWVTGLIRFARDRGLTRVEATAAGSIAWTDHVIETSEGLLFAEVNSWMTGINRNVEGKQVRRIMRYSGGHPKFRERCEAVAADGYRELGAGVGVGGKVNANGGHDGCRHDDGVRQLRLGELFRPARMGRGNPPRAARRRSRLRLPVVGRTSLQRLLVRPRQPSADDVSDGGVPEHRSGHRRGHRPLARSAARRRAGGGARPAEQGPIALGHRPRAGAARVRRFPHEHGRIARALRRSGADDRQRAQDRIHRRRRQILQAAADRDPPAAAAFLRRPHLCGGVERGFGRVRRQARRAYGDVRRPPVGDAVAGDRARARTAPQVPRHRAAARHADRVLVCGTDLAALRGRGAADTRANSSRAISTTTNSSASTSRR